MTYTAFANGRSDTATNLSKYNDDLYWSVVAVSPEGELLENYLVHSLQANFFVKYEIFRFRYVAFGLG